MQNHWEYSDSWLYPILSFSSKSIFTLLNAYHTKDKPKENGTHPQPRATALSIRPSLPATISCNPNSPQKHRNTSESRSYRIVSFHATQNLPFPLLRKPLGAVLMKSPICVHVVTHMLQFYFKTLLRNNTLAHPQLSPNITHCRVLNSKKSTFLAPTFQQQLFFTQSGLAIQHEEMKSWCQMPLV